LMLAVSSAKKAIIYLIRLVLPLFAEMEL
jgi:hypothetical protein